MLDATLRPHARVRGQVGRFKRGGLTQLPLSIHGLTVQLPRQEHDVGEVNHKNDLSVHRLGVEAWRLGGLEAWRWRLGGLGAVEPERRGVHVLSFSFSAFHLQLNMILGVQFDCWNIVGLRTP